MTKVFIITCIQIMLWWVVLPGITASWGKKKFGEDKTKRILWLLVLFLLAVTIGIAILFFAQYMEGMKLAAGGTAEEYPDMAELRDGMGMEAFWLVSPLMGIGGQRFRLLQMFVSSALLVIAYIIAFYKKGEMTLYILQIVFMILAPFIGPVFLILSWMLQKFFFSKEVNLRELSFRKDTMRSILRPDEEKERNVVPVKEALLVSDTQDKRRVMLDVLKGEYEKSLTVITDALENPDTEISHYAASVITEVKSNFKLTVQSMQEQLKDYPDDPAMKAMLIQYIHDFLGKGVLSNIEAMTYITIYLKLMEELFQQDEGLITGTMYKDMLQHLMETQNKEEAERWARRALENAPEELATYKGVLKYYYETGNKEVFFNVLQQLKSSDVVLDKETLEIVRLFK